jgi:hypothetical protein
MKYSTRIYSLKFRAFSTLYFHFSAFGEVGGIKKIKNIDIFFVSLLIFTESCCTICTIPKMREYAYESY